MSLNYEYIEIIFSYWSLSDFLDNGIEAHACGLRWVDKFAKNQGYSDFSEYLEKKIMCQALNLAFLMLAQNKMLIRSK